MEFKLRAGDDPPPSYFSSHRYLAAPPLPVGHTTKDFQPLDWLQPRGESFTREAEKACIRKEIIKKEILRNRELFDEVVKEMVVERGIALRRQPDGLPFVDRTVAMPCLPEVGFAEGLPVVGWYGVQGGPERLAMNGEVRPARPEVGERRIVFLGKSTMNPNVAGRKRKAEEAAVAETPSPSLNQKETQKEWSCALCQVSTTSLQGLNDHLCGKKHKSKEAQLAASAGHVPNLKLEKQQLVSRTHREQVVKRQAIGGSGDNAVIEYWCKTCNIWCNSEAVMATHLIGKKHMAMVHRGGRVGGVEEVEEAIEGNVDGIIKAEEQHREEGNRESVEEAEATVATGGAASDGKVFMYSCKQCNILCNSEAVMVSHLRGKKHMSRVHRQQDGGGPISSDQVVGTHEGMEENVDGEEIRMVKVDQHSNGVRVSQMSEVLAEVESASVPC
ncbi:uncharacterized protein LOC131217027 [Magnolia sinica]|uniref:uncharacterized protein LOC131217027 n=1 Tax=Magnolia sinica TaxID=86752 RepID=UPI0026585D03|nr:uncharacterized protein LOC131217027 [Magnolia sinica]XP_058067692.1 uncharacterized protein LOC131217027 [Magnolia sinica]